MSMVVFILYLTLVPIDVYVNLMTVKKKKKITMTLQEKVGIGEKGKKEKGAKEAEETEEEKNK